VYLVSIIAFDLLLHILCVSSFGGGVAGLLASRSWPASRSARIYTLPATSYILPTS